MVLIRNLMQIFPKARLNPQCYCTWWQQFLRGFWQKTRIPAPKPAKDAQKAVAEN
jgi:hypothetical protein